MKNNSHQDLVSNQRNVYNVIYETNYRTWRKSYMDLTKLSAYEIIEHRDLSDLKSEGALLKHKKSGARVLLISNDDENKVINNDNKSLLLKNKGIFLKAKNKGTVASEPISEPPYININDNIIAHIKLGNFFLFLELLIIGIFFECMLFLQS